MGSTHRNPSKIFYVHRNNCIMGSVFNCANCHSLECVNLDCCNALMIAWIGCICVSVIGFIWQVFVLGPQSIFFCWFPLVDFPLFDAPRQAFHWDLEELPCFCRAIMMTLLWLLQKQRRCPGQTCCRESHAC